MFSDRSGEISYTGRVCVEVNRKCSIRGFTRGEGLVVNNARVPFRLKLLNRSSTSILIRTVVSTLLNTTTLNSVKGLFPSASRGCGNTSDVLLLGRIYHLLTRCGCEVIGVSSAIVTRRPGLGPRVSRVEGGVTGTYKVSVSLIDIGTAARRGLNFANELRNVSTRTIYLVRRCWGIVTSGGTRVLLRAFSALFVLVGRIFFVLEGTFISVALYTILLVSPFIKLGIGTLDTSDVSTPSTILVRSSANGILFRGGPRRREPYTSMAGVVALLLIFRTISDKGLDLSSRVATSRRTTKVNKDSV